MTTLNAVVISIRLVVSLFIQRLLAELVGESGIAKIGQLRNVNQLLTSVSSGGVFNGIIKYVSEYKDDKGKQDLKKGAPKDPNETGTKKSEKRMPGFMYDQ